MQLSYGPWGETLDEQVAAARAAEDAGVAMVWTPELHRSAFVPAAAMAAATERVGVGTGIAWAFARSEMVTALTALDLDELSGGRFVLGLGTGVKRLVEDWHQRPFGKPATHLRESVALIRRIVADAHRGERIAVDGEHVTVDIRGYERPFAPVRERIPVHIAAVGPGMTRLAGEVGDGWISHELTSPRFVRERILPNLERGLTDAGRARDEVTRVVSAVCVPSEDAAQARRWAAGLVAFYASVRTYADFFDFHGFAGEAETARERFKAGDVAGMTAAVTDEMVDTFTLAGTPDAIRRRLAEYDDLADLLKLTPPTHHVDAEVTRTVQDAILELVA